MQEDKGSPEQERSLNGKQNLDQWRSELEYPGKVWVAAGCQGARGSQALILAQPMHKKDSIPHPQHLHIHRLQNTQGQSRQLGGKVFGAKSIAGQHNSSSN